MYTERVAPPVRAAVMAPAMVRLGISRVPGFASLPRGETNTALAASPSIPSQFVSRNIRSGASDMVVLHSQPLPGIPSRSRQPIAQVFWHMPITHAATWFAPAMHARPHAPQFIASVW
jgi:hypothetical protein